jgi:hypothetical protein
MKIRAYDSGDFEELSRIHQQYQNEFQIDEFGSGLLELISASTDDKLVAVGGIRLIPEAVIVTDKTQPVKIRREALIKMLQAMSYLTNRVGYKQIHAFIQDDVWLKQLLKHGFRKTAGVAVVTDI